MVSTVIALAALVAGAAVSWWLGSRARNTVTTERDRAREELATTRVAHATDRESLAGAEEQVKALREQGPQLTQAMKAISGDVLAETSKQLREQFEHQRKTDQELARKELDQRTERIETLVKPVTEKLAAFDKKVDEVEKARNVLNGSFSEQLKSLGIQVEQLGSRTSSLVDALKKPNVRGAWGELQLRSVIERAGMNSYCDFTEQSTSTDGDGRRLRPDVLVRLPGDKLIVVDAKVPLDAFLAAQEAETTEAAEVAMAHHARQVREHIKTLATKRYQDQFDNAADLVVMFLPNEGIYHGALDADRSLFDFAVDQNVLIATPTTLIALLRAVNYGWTQERLAKSAREIAGTGQELHKRIVDFANSFALVGKNIGTVVTNYNKAVGTLDSRVLPQVERLEALDAKSAKELTDTASIDQVPRVTKLVAELEA